MAGRTLHILAALIGSALAFAAAPVCAQQPPMQPLDSMKVKPLKAPSLFKVSTAPAVRETADRHVESNALGFDNGVAPAPGEIVVLGDRRYEVTDVSAIGGGPTFSGNGKFVVAPAGGRLLVGLKALDADKMAALPAPSGRALN
jgi:hypothetical protein